jgi:hypothetical protein
MRAGSLPSGPLLSSRILQSTLNVVEIDVLAPCALALPTTLRALRWGTNRGCGRFLRVLALGHRRRRRGRERHGSNSRCRERLGKNRRPAARAGGRRRARSPHSHGGLIAAFLSSIVHSLAHRSSWCNMSVEELERNNRLRWEVLLRQLYSFRYSGHEEAAEVFVNTIATIVRYFSEDDHGHQGGSLPQDRLAVRCMCYMLNIVC